MNSGQTGKLKGIATWLLVNQKPLNSFPLAHHRLRFFNHCVRSLAYRQNSKYPKIEYPKLESKMEFEESTFQRYRKWEQFRHQRVFRR